LLLCLLVLMLLWGQWLLLRLLLWCLVLLLCTVRVAAWRFDLVIG